MHRRYRYWMVLLCCLPLQLMAQQKVDFENIFEAIFAVQEEDVDYDELYEYLFQLYANPVNLNEATREDLLAIYLLSERQINNLLSYRQAYGDLLTIYELSFIPGFDRLTITHLLPFVTVEAAARPPVSWRERIGQADRLWLSRLETTLEPKRGYLLADTISDATAVARYTGSPYKHYQRLRLSLRNDFSVGLTAEKDAGEAFRWHPTARQGGYDYYSFHAHLQHRGRLKDFILGDYTLQFGQGLLLGSGFSRGKGAETVQAVRGRSLGIRPYTSAMESGFFRGVAATYVLPAGQHTLEATVFYSNLRQDGRLQQDTTDYGQTFGSLQTTGFHRTASELAARNTLKEQSWGSHLTYGNAANTFHAGMLYVQTDFSHPWQKPDRLYYLYEFSGIQNYNGGVHMDYTWGKVSWFGEVARSKSGGTGALAGLTAYLSAQLQGAMVIRDYDKKFHSFYGNAFGENTRNLNEQGIYWGLKAAPLRRTVLAAYYDYFRFPWMRYRASAPSEGYEYLLRIDHTLNRQTNLYLQYREETKSGDVDGVLAQVLPGSKKSLALNLRHQVSEPLRIRTRVQHSQYTLNGKTTRGFAIAQDASLALGKWKADVRYALFNTDDYANRQYVYENDVLYAFSVPAYSGLGTRSYLVLRYEINRHMQTWFRVARTIYEDRTAIGSSLETIEGNARTDLKFQFLVKF